MTLRIYSHVLREHALGVEDIFAQAVKVALVFALGVKAPVAAATAIGIAAALTLLVVALRYEHRRLTPQVLTAHGTGMAGGPGAG